MSPRLPHQVHAAYHSSMIAGLSSQEIWITALEYLVKKLRSAKLARGEGKFEDAFQSHQRVLAVLAVLRAHVDGTEGPVPTEHAEASATLVSFYDQLRDVLSDISARTDAALRYDLMVGQCLHLVARLRSAAENNIPFISKEYPKET